MADNKRLIRDIVSKRVKPPAVRPEPKPEFSGPGKKPVRTRNVFSGNFKSGLRRRGLRFYVWLAGAILALIVFLLLTDALSSVLIKITPAQEFIEINSALKAEGDGKGPLTLPVEIMRLEQAERKVVKASGSKEIKRKAEGEVVIFNAFSSEPQTLVADTRFETPQGKIYKISKTIVVPGVRVEAGKIIPNSITATVYADQPGEDYNIGLTDFTIPGFKGTPKYEKFYARSKTEMTGGFLGRVSVVEEKDLAEAREPLRQKIREDIFKSASEKIPQGFIFYKEASELVFIEEGWPEKGAEVKEFEGLEKGVLTALLIPRQALERALTGAYLGQEMEEKVEILNLEEFSFRVLEKEVKSPRLLFSLSGRAHFVWTIDWDSLKNDLVLNRKEYGEVFEKYPMIKKAEVVFQPAWWRFFPRKTSKINIERIL